MMEIRGLKFTHKSIKLMGGEGSGHHGHTGRPGSVGGSAPKGRFPSKRSDASNVTIFDASETEEKQIRGYLEDLPQDHIDAVTSIRIVPELGHPGEINNKGEIKISRSEKGELAWDPETQTYQRNLPGLSSQEDIIHEVGHAVYFSLIQNPNKMIGNVKGVWFDMQLQQAFRIHNNLNSNNHISGYAIKSHLDFFSESYVSFVHSTKNRRLAQISNLMEPELGWNYYSLVKEVFGGKEYGK